MNVSDDAEHAEILRSGTWGAFRLTAKQAGGTNGEFGGYQARCPFHRKNASTDCKRYLRLKDGSREERLLVLRQLMWWCTMAPQHIRQRLHLVQPLPAESTPSYAHVRALRIDVKPLTRPRTDDELDAGLAPAAASGSTDAPGRAPRRTQQH